jgi:hypothetical protein
MSINKIINNFTKFLNKQKCIVPTEFIKKYFVLTMENFVSFSDCFLWLEIERDNLLKTIKGTYKEGVDYFEISVEEDNKIIKFNLSVNKVNSSPPLILYNFIYFCIISYTSTQTIQFYGI